MKLREKNKFLFYPSIFLVVCFVDQTAKYFAGKYFTIICNRGVAFGVGQSGLILSLLALVFVLWLLVHENNKKQKLFLAIILGAGSSNLLDRLFFGCVRDFINFGIIPTFNIADAVITFVVILLFINLIMRNKNEA